MLITPAPRRWKQDCHEFEDSLDYMINPIGQSGIHNEILPQIRLKEEIH